MNGPGPDLLGSIPLGGLLSRVLQLLVAADRREEFVGDLVEQANDQLSHGTPRQIGRWLWGQTLQSAPSLLLSRARRFARALSLSHPGHGGRPVAASGWVFGGRTEARSWSVPMAISVSAHALAVGALFLFTLGQIEEIDAPWVQVALKRAFAPATATAMIPSASEVPERRAHRKARVTPRTAGPLEAPVLTPPPLTSTDQVTVETDLAPIEDPIERSIVIVLPPPVAEKRCLSCPSPRLPPAFVRLGAAQQVLVKTCVGSKGDVTSVDVLRGLGALADASVVDTVRGWRFSPHSVGDHPVPFCYPTRFLFTMN